MSTSQEATIITTGSTAAANGSETLTEFNSVSNKRKYQESTSDKELPQASSSNAFVSSTNIGDTAGADLVNPSGFPESKAQNGDEYEEIREQASQNRYCIIVCCLEKKIVPKTEQLVIVMHLPLAGLVFGSSSQTYHVIIILSIYRCYSFLHDTLEIYRSLLNSISFKISFLSPNTGPVSTNCKHCKNYEKHLTRKRENSERLEGDCSRMRVRIYLFYYF